MKAWKFLDPAYADGGLRGSFRIATPSEYAALEDAQVDQYDSAKVRRITQAQVTDTSDPEQLSELRRLDSMGMTLENCRGSFTFENIEERTSVDGYSLCLTAASNNVAFGAKSAVLEIADVEHLALILTLANSRLSQKPIARLVTYGDVVVEATEDNRGPADPFLKDWSFGGEEEVRIFWPVANAHDWFVTEPINLPTGLVKQLR